MKKIIVISVVIFLLNGLTLFSQSPKKAGTISAIDIESNEVYVGYGQMEKPFQINELLHVAAENENITLEAIFPMRSQAKCRVIAKDRAFLSKLRKGMIVYYGAGVRGNQPVIKMYIAGDHQIFGGIEMTYCPAGSFMMGSVSGKKRHIDLGNPRHKVTLDEFWIGKYEITQKEYQFIMKKNPSIFKDKPDNPVENVCWYRAVEFCNILSTQNGFTPFYNIDKENTIWSAELLKVLDTMRWKITYNADANGFRLPTEAEWEYACRAGIESVYYWGNTLDEEYLWCSANSNSETHSVGQKKPNNWGIFDICGNVSEWCNDWYSDSYYTDKEAYNPKGPDHGLYRVIRGNSFQLFNRYESSARGACPASMLAKNIGFRVVLQVQK